MAGEARRGVAAKGPAIYGWRRKAGNGPGRIGWNGPVWRGGESKGPALQGTTGKEWCSRIGAEMHGLAGIARRGSYRMNEAGLGWIGMERLYRVWTGWVRLAAQGGVRCG